ncbi:MAG: sialidase family protein [Pirellulales bacterium]
MDQRICNRQDNMTRRALLIYATLFFVLPAPSSLLAQSHPRLIDKSLFVPTTGPGVRINGYAYYTRSAGVEMISRYSEQTQSDKADVAYQRHSNDNGHSWSNAVSQITHVHQPQGTIRTGRYPGFVDSEHDLLLVMILQGILPTDNPLEGMKHWTLHYSLSDDGGQTEYHQGQVIQAGEEFSADNPLSGVYTGKNSAMIGDTTCRPIRIRTGQILQPIQITPIGPNGEYENPGGGYTYHDAAVLIGTWNKSLQLDWKLSERVRADPNFSTRGMIEPTIAEFPDGQILMVMRGSNDVKPHLPGYRWMSVSRDGGHHWTSPKPWTYEDGTPFFSPSSCSQLLVHSSGRIFWIGNISPTNPRGNHPRYPLVLGEVDRQSMALKQATLCTLDNRGPKDAERMQISNFFADEDRQTGEIRIYAAPLFRKQPKPTVNRGNPGLDWTADLWLTRVDVGD